MSEPETSRWSVSGELVTVHVGRMAAAVSAHYVPLKTSPLTADDLRTISNVFQQAARQMDLMKRSAVRPLGARTAAVFRIMEDLQPHRLCDLAREAGLSPGAVPATLDRLGCMRVGRGVYQMPNPHWQDEKTHKARARLAAREARKEAGNG